MNSRPVARVPRVSLALLAGAFVAQLVVCAGTAAPEASAPVLHPAPPGLALRVAAGGEPAVLARGLILWLQAFDYRGGASHALLDLDYRALVEWLDRILGLDPRSEYPLRAAVLVYANVRSPEKVRSMLDFVHAKFLEDPNRRWRWLAVAALLARHRLGDRPLALRYALALTERGTGPMVAAWARDMSLGLLRESGKERDAAALARRLLASGRVTAPHEVRYLKREFPDALPGSGAR